MYRGTGTVHLCTALIIIIVSDTHTRPADSDLAFLANEDPDPGSRSKSRYGTVGTYLTFVQNSFLKILFNDFKILSYNYNYFYMHLRIRGEVEKKLKRDNVFLKF